MAFAGRLKAVVLGQAASFGSAKIRSVSHAPTNVAWSIRRARVRVEAGQPREAGLDCPSGGLPMTIQPTRSLLTQISLGFLLIIIGGTQSQADDWTLEKQADGIDVYTRPVAGSYIKEFKGEGVVGVDVEDIVGLLRDAGRFKDWFPNTSESRLVKREGDTSYQYSVMATPWPISDRDNVFRSVTTRDESTGRVEITVNAAPTEVPIQDGRHRVTRAKGSWQLTPQGPERTLVTFIMHLEPGGGLPDWMVNARIVATPFEALMNLRKILRATPTN
jgi:hypothetical protein